MKRIYCNLVISFTVESKESEVSSSLVESSLQGWDRYDSLQRGDQWAVETSDGWDTVECVMITRLEVRRIDL